MKIAIAGYGLEGESSYLYWSKDANNQITIFDERKPSRELPDGIETVISSDAFEKMYGYDLVIRTAGLAPRKIKTDGKIWSSTNEFFDKCPAKIIGVTGSKGKGTTASLIASILRAAGKKVWLLGNIGEPSLSNLDQIQSDDIVVYELSSFQLWDIEKSPSIAVVLFIEQEHLDVHASMEEYVAAKANITKYQTSEDILVYNKFNDYARSIADDSGSQLVGYPDKLSAHVKTGQFCYGDQFICSVDVLQIIGEHNHENACAAIDAIWYYTQDISVIEKGLRDFTGLPHRLQFVDEIDGVKYYDDSIATTPSSAIAALRSFNGPKVIILGGSSKGSDYTELSKELKVHESQAILIGDEANNIAATCERNGFYDYEIIHDANMEKVVRRAREMANAGGYVLLSPASASFGLFKNYADRGDQFREAVKMLQYI